ncbi:hypothetical protein LWI28_018614 [Acer negundo]|uniref:Uncharacterized protein n=1 Tax=Acer negundo TaxID=4023 RepID=A0AAD5IEZ3_ACENE|nr:hypothetical protein LWI28_018614 [Acer negundo]
MLESVNSLPKAAQGSVHHRYFGGCPTPLKDILDRLRREGFDEADYVIKLGYVYFLSHIMLGREYRCIGRWRLDFDWFGWKAEKGENETGIFAIDEMVLQEETTTIGKKNSLPRRFDPLAVVGPELHKHVGYDPENEAGRRGTRGHANDLRSYIESCFEQIDLKIDKLRADIHALVPPVPIASQPTWSTEYTRSFAESSIRRYDMEEIGEAEVDDEQQGEFEVEDDQVDTQQDIDNYNDGEDVVRELNNVLGNCYGVVTRNLI